MGTTSKRYSAEIRARAVRMVSEHRDQYGSQRAAIQSIAGKIGRTSESLRRWVQQAERDEGKSPGLSTSDRERLKQLDRENRELKRANEILRTASAYISAAWDEVVVKRDAEDRFKFIMIVAPALQGKINAKRVELMAPLEELQMAMVIRLRSEYDNMRAINSTLTALLQSASDLDANRKRYLERTGASSERMEKFIDDASAAVSDLVENARNVQERMETAALIKNAEEFSGVMLTLLTKLA